ncbi:cytochrome b5 [Impatiens glandulifera]|uniref:cytochrome b5 n=1 Tax=Impatiens glandulifera TaxID=253017 RepID=UPI001FB1983A|nr:cytochrome b5 [Impatiens glandulifera]
MPIITKLYSMEEVAQHNSKEDCWIVIDGKVYEVSSYLDEHPGGDEVILQATGKDATDEFEDAGHSEEAREQLEAFCIGELDQTAPAIPEMKIVSKKKQSSGGIVPKLTNFTKQQSWVLPVGGVGISLVVVSLLYYRRK